MRLKPGALVASFEATVWIPFQIHTFQFSFIFFSFAGNISIFNSLFNTPRFTSSPHLRLLPCLGHKPPTRVLHASRSLAVCSSCGHVFLIFSMSAFRSRRHEFLGLPTFLFPCGFQDREFLVMFPTGFRNVCPIHLHRRCSISISAAFWSVLCHSSSLLILSGL